MKIQVKVNLDTYSIICQSLDECWHIKLKNGPEIRIFRSKDAYEEEFK